MKHIFFDCLAVFAAGLVLGSLVGCEVKDRQGHVIVNQRPPVVNVRVNPDVHVELRRPFRHPKCKCCDGKTRCLCGTRCGCSCRMTYEAPPKGTVFSREHPVMNLPLKARQRNWAGPRGGSCVIASTTNLFRWQGRDDLAELFRRSYSGGQTHDSLAAKLDRHHVRYASTLNGDVSFLEWAIRTRRGAGLTYGFGHYQNVIDLDDENMTLLDNNDPAHPYKVPRARAIAHWHQCGGWATALLLPPASPLP